VLISRLYLDGLQFYHRKFFVDLFWISIIVSNDYNKYTLMPKNDNNQINNRPNVIVKCKNDTNRGLRLNLSARDS